jgi:hypothetical protein
MGLAGRKVKQRISRDPNNLVWSNGKCEACSTSLSLTMTYLQTQANLALKCWKRWVGHQERVSIYIECLTFLKTGKDEQVANASFNIY